MNNEFNNVFLRITLRILLCLLMAPFILALLILFVPFLVLFMIAYLFIPAIGRYGSFLHFSQNAFHWKKNGSARSAFSGGTPPADAADGGIDVESKVLRSEIIDEPDSKNKSN